METTNTERMICGMTENWLDFMHAESADYVATIYQIARALNLSRPAPDMPHSECSRAAWKRVCREMADTLEHDYGADFDRTGFLQFCGFIASEV